MPGHPAEALVAFCDALGLDAVEVEARGTGTWLARTLHTRDPARFALGSLHDEPAPDAQPPAPGSFAPHPMGAHLFAAWHHVRDAAILGGWERRQPPRFDTLDPDTLH